MNELTNIQEKPEILRILDLGIGNPVFMQEYWGLVDKVFSGVGIEPTHINDYMLYDYTQSHPMLKNEIKALHDTQGNVETSGYEIVIGNGASQLIAAAAYAASSLGTRDFILKTPTWGRLPTLLKMGSDLADTYSKGRVYPAGDYVLHSKYTELMVLPNNPDGSVAEKTQHSDDAQFRIHDLCYWWPQYTKELHKRSDDVMIFGLAKATGHAGTRIGWSLVRDSVFAQKMKKYVELTTSGVSLDAQKRAVTILKTIKHLKNQQFTSCFEFAKAELDNRWSILLAVAAKSNGFKILNSNGMFAWCKCESIHTTDKFCDTFQVLALPGSSFGLTSEFFRVSMGCSSDDFKQFIARLEEK